jgi:hypothetical protein
LTEEKQGVTGRELSSRMQTWVLKPRIKANDMLLIATKNAVAFNNPELVELSRFMGRPGDQMKNLSRASRG